MPPNRPRSFQNLVIYEIFVRNHSPAGTLAGVTADLPRIRSLGVDVVWLMPIHPIGRVRRKGPAGSPYAIADYRAVNSEYGDEADFEELVRTAHAMGLRVMIDLVYNHTSPDSVLARQHPDWFYRDPAGQPFPRNGEWSDVVDLDYSQAGLAEVLLEAMLKWVRLGVDGFRCDVASLVPLAFWQQARAAAAEIKPDFIWLAESVHPYFIRSMRRQGYLALADAELYQVFDLTYDYDIQDEWLACLKGELSLTAYAQAVERQAVTYPAQAGKLRFVENHDQPRLAGRLYDLNRVKSWTAWMAFLPGAFLIYAGQETATGHLPSLFEVDPVDWPPPGQTPVLSDFLTRLARLKKEPALEGQFDILTGDTHLQARWDGEGQGLYGIFNVQGYRASVPVDLPDGRYENLVDDGEIAVSGGRVLLPAGPVVVRYGSRDVAEV